MDRYALLGNKLKRCEIARRFYFKKTWGEKLPKGMFLTVYEAKKKNTFNT